MKKKILIMGPVPPPYGGVCVHIIRLYQFLKADYKFDFIDEFALRKDGVFNIRSKRFDIYIKKILASDIVFVHSGTTALRYLNILVARLLLRKVILTIHSYPSVKNKFNKWLDEFFFGMADKVILVNEIMAHRIRINSSKLLIKNAFIPPFVELEPEIPDSIRNWMDIRKKNGTVLLVGNASKLELFNNQDLYGLDLCIEAMAELRKQSVDSAMVFNVSDTQKYTERYIAFQERIEKLELRDRFLLISEQISFYRLMMLANIVVRPTNTDGDSLTIREAIFLGKPIIASDVISRPEGTILFKNREVESFVQSIKRTITANGEAKALPIINENDPVAFYKLLFEEINVK